MNQHSDLCRVLAVITCFFCAACSTTLPVVLVGPNGEVYRGMTHAALSGGSFGVTDGTNTCQGTYNALDLSPVLTIPATCSDGRTGIITATRESDGMAGMGTVAVSDGTTWGFGFGRDAAIIEQRAIKRAHPPVPPAPELTAVVASNPVIDSYSVDGSRHSIDMTSEGGTYVIPVTINDAIKLNFVIDSGAADVAIPADVVLTLFRTGTVSNSDFLGSKTYQLADGSTLPSPTFRIRSLRIGDITVANVTAGLAPVKGNLLLGQSFLNRFKSWSMDNKLHALVLEGTPTP